jgi:hypothetical protein
MARDMHSLDSTQIKDHVMCHSVNLGRVRLHAVVRAMAMTRKLDKRTASIDANILGLPM